MNKKQISEYILNHLKDKSKNFNSSGERLAYQLGFVVSVLTEICEKNYDAFSLVKKKLNKDEINPPHS